MTAAQPDFPDEVDKRNVDGADSVNAVDALSAADGVVVLGAGFFDDDDDDVDEPWPWVMLVAAVCTLAIALPYWMADYGDIESSGIGTYAILVVAVLSGAALVVSGLHLGSRLETAMALCCPAPIAVVGRVLIDTAGDPTTHNLWPIELAVAVGISVPPVVAGILLGWVIRRAFVVEAPESPEL